MKQVDAVDLRAQKDGATTFTFDLRSALIDASLSERSSSEKSLTTSTPGTKDCLGLLSFSLLLTASQYDAFVFFFTSLGIPAAIKFIGRLDILFRICLFIYTSVYAFMLSTEDPMPEPQLGRASGIYFVAFFVSLVLYMCERLASRFELDARPRASIEYLTLFGDALLNRSNFPGPFTAIFIPGVYVAFILLFAWTMANALSILETVNDMPAFLLVIFCHVSEVCYTLARFGRFKGIVEQGMHAAQFASVHSTFSTLFSIPISLVYIVLVATR